ncbi:MAG: hypothetical protein ACI9J3_003556 [Parvicellaceae bacterium]|jgi:hypothetical protein
MKVLQSFFLLIIISSFFSFQGCQNNKPTPNPELLNIDLLRGDIILCSGKKFGEVSFSLACKNSVRETFDLALSLLHSFEYGEAEKAFVQVIDADPECAMAYWGVAMSIYHALWSAPKNQELEKGSKLVNIAQSLSKSPKEEMYINAIHSFYEDWKNLDHKTRALKYEKQMESIYKNSKEDTEAAIFYALALNSTADPSDDNYTNQRKAGKILESLSAEQPNHPGIAHYIIHNYDNPVLAPKALSTARRYAEIAPASSHAQHMPSHIFTRLGLWEESIQSNLNSASSAQCYVESAGLKGYWFQEVHAIDYLVYAYLQKGDNSKANEQYQYVKTMQEVNPAGIWAVAYPFAAIPARMALENRNWSEAAQLNLHSSEIQWEKFPWQKAILHFGRALGAAHNNDFNAAEEEITILKKLRQDLIDINDSYKANQVMIQIKAAQAWMKFENDEPEEGLALMKEASEMENNTSKHPVTPGEILPADELLGDMLLAMNKSSEALEAYEKNLQVHPNRFNGIYGAAIAAKESGAEKKATMYFENLIRLTEGTESQRPELQEANEFLKKI